MRPGEVLARTEFPDAASADLLWVVVAAQVEREEEMGGMAPDKYREVFGLAQRGILAFRDRRFDEVIDRWVLAPSQTRFVCMQSSCQCLGVSESGLEVRNILYDGLLVY